MDDFVKLNPEERRIFFEGTAAPRNIQAQIVEKDFWVCWTLKELFRLPVVGEHLIFKGGTSLSKVFKVIERFSVSAGRTSPRWARVTKRSSDVSRHSKPPASRRSTLNCSRHWKRP